MRFQPVVVDLSDFKYTDEPIFNDEPSSYDDAGYRVQHTGCRFECKTERRKAIPEPSSEVFDAADYAAYASGVQFNQ